MSMSLVEVNTNVKSFFDAFNILDMGIALIWIVGSFFLANAISEKKDERALSTLIFIMFGGLIFFAEDPVKYVFLIVAVFITIYGFFKMLWRRKNYPN